MTPLGQGIRCPNCGGPSHPASGWFCGRDRDGWPIVICGPCTRRFWRWFMGHQSAFFSAGWVADRRREPGRIVFTPRQVFVRFYDHVTRPPAGPVRAVPYETLMDPEDALYAEYEPGFNDDNDHDFRDW